MASEPRTAKTVRLPDGLWLRLEAEAREQRRSVANLIETMLAKALDGVA